MKITVPGLKTLIFGQYGSLLASLVLVMLLQPTVGTQAGKLILEGFLIVVLIAGLRAIEVQKGLFRFEVFLLIASLICGIAGSLMGQESLFVLGLAGRALFLCLVALIILIDLFRSREVTGDTLAGAVCVYLLIALICGHGFMLVEFAVPESFSFTQGQARMNLWVAREFYPFFYFSLVTITTVGYGDMAPMTTVARTLAMTEALTGQIYLTVLVARLVGMYLAGHQDVIKSHLKEEDKAD